MPRNTLQAAKYRCTECGKEVTLQKRRFKGLVLTCACGQLQNVKTDSMLPQEWSG